jgi:hypothetical protein
MGGAAVWRRARRHLADHAATSLDHPQIGTVQRARGTAHKSPWCKVMCSVFVRMLCELSRKTRSPEGLTKRSKKSNEF